MAFVRNGWYVAALSDQAFKTEDEPMIADVYRNMEAPDLLALSPVLLPGDAAGVRARRILKQLREQEAGKP